MMRAMVKAQGVVMPERKTKADYGVYIDEFADEAAAIYNAALDEVARLNAAPVQQVSVPAWMASSRAFADRLYMAGWRDHADAQHSGVAGMYDELLYAAPAAPAADAGLVEALCKVEQALDLIGGIRHGKNVTQDELWQSCELLDAALAAHRAQGVV